MKYRCKSSVLFLLLTLFILSGCAGKEPSVVKTYGSGENTVKYYEMSDGTWKTDQYSYQYRLEITGKMNGAAKETTFIYLSNIKEIPFEKACLAGGLSSDSDDYYEEKDAVCVSIN